MKTTETDLEVLSNYLRNQVGWVEIDRIKKAIPKKHSNAMKFEAMRHVGLLERDGNNVKLSVDGREYAGGDAAARAEVLRRRRRADPLYSATLEWMHFNNKILVPKTEIANYWHDHHADEIGGARGDALTDSTVFFMRMVGAAELGKFVADGAGRDTQLRMDEGRLQSFVTLEPPTENRLGGDQPVAPAATAAATPAPVSASPRVNIGAGLNVNVEIHVAANAKPATIEEIFKNMRKYLIDGAESAADGG
jgi:hypothetical protein